MKKITVLSDTHGNLSAINDIMTVMSESDIIIHLGDTSKDGNYIRRLFPHKTYLLNGNCDFDTYGKDELVINVEGVKIFACHGHMYSVKSTLDKLVARAKESDCKVALYGHTHMAEENEINGVLTVNPGNMSRYSRNSYCYIVINGEKVVPVIVYTDQRNL